MTTTPNDLHEIVYCLSNNLPLDAGFKEHQMRSNGKFANCRSVHLKGNLILLYRIKKSKIVLTRIGTHEQLGITVKRK